MRLLVTRWWPWHWSVNAMPQNSGCVFTCIWPRCAANISIMVENGGNVLYHLRRRPLQWDDDPDRYSRQSQEVQEHSHWESSCQSSTCQRWAFCDNVSFFVPPTFVLLTHGSSVLLTVSIPQTPHHHRLQKHLRTLYVSKQPMLSLLYHTVCLWIIIQWQAIYPVI